MSAKFLKRYEAVFLVHHAKGPKLTYKADAKYMRKSKAFVKTWVKRYMEVRNVDDLPERGRLRVKTTKEDKTILRLFQDLPGLSLRCGQIKLRKKGIYVSHDSKSPAWKKRVFSINFEDNGDIFKASLFSLSSLLDSISSFLSMSWVIIFYNGVEVTTSFILLFNVFGVKALLSFLFNDLISTSSSFSNEGILILLIVILMICVRYDIFSNW